MNTPAPVHAFAQRQQSNPWDQAAAGWNEHGDVIRRWLRDVTGAMLDAARITAGLRVLATSSAQRSAYMPDVPTFVEQGHRNLVVREWFAFFLPGKASAAVVDATWQILRQGIARPELATALAVAGMTPAPSTPAAMAERIAQEQRYWAPVIQSAGVRIES